MSYQPKNEYSVLFQVFVNELFSESVWFGAVVCMPGGGDMLSDVWDTVAVHGNPTDPQRQTQAWNEID